MTDENWIDSNHQITVNIPDRLFAVANPTEKTNVLPFHEYLEPFLMENRPVSVDIPYEETISDVRGEKAGWYDKALEVLNTK